MHYKKFVYYWNESKGIVLSLAITAAVLPFALWAMVSRQQILTWVRASPTERLMIWLEPSEVVMKTGQEVSLNIFAEYSGGDRLIPALKTKASLSSGLQTEKQEIEYNFGFSGRKKLGTIKVIAKERGDQSVAIEESNVFTSLPDLVIVTTGAKITVK